MSKIQSKYKIGLVLSFLIVFLYPSMLFPSGNVYVCSLLNIPKLQEKKVESKQAKLKEILKNAAEYCVRLNGMVFDFVCHEEMTEETYTYKQSRVISRRGLGLEEMDVGRQFSYVKLELRRKKKKTYVYDYQMIKKGDINEEKRILIEENGKKRNKANVDPNIQRFLFQNIVYGPAGFLSPYWQRFFTFEIVGEETIEDKKAAVIQATPNTQREENYSFGNIWIDLNDYSVFKIEWEPQSIQNFEEEVTSSAGTLKRDLSWSVTYNTEKNGIKFPSKQIIKEVFITADEKKHPKCIVTINYTNYKFFTVETTIKNSQESKL